MNEQLKKALWSVLVGAAVAFITTLLQGLLTWVQQAQFDFAGPATAVLWFLKNNKA